MRVPVLAADGQQMVNIICSALRAVAAEQGTAIDDVCHSNATAIAQTVAELEHMQSAVEDVKASLLGANQTMQVSCNNTDVYHDHQHMVSNKPCIVLKGSR
jgi:hypothetical protein